MPSDSFTRNRDMSSIFRNPPIYYGITVLVGTTLPLLLWPNLWANLLSSDQYMPHGHCFLWEPGLIRLHLTTDCLIGFSYLVISGTLAYLLFKARRSLPFNWIFMAFGIFILACAATHFMEVWTLWTPQYWLAGGVKLVTAVASVMTASALPLLMPRILAFIETARISEQRGGQMEAHATALASINEALETEVTARKRAEAELQTAHEAALQRRDSQYQTLTEIVPVGIFRADAMGDVIYVNAAWLNLAGVNFEEGRNDGWLNAVHPDDRERIHTAWQAGMGQTMPFGAEFRFLHRDGVVKWVTGMARAECSNMGEITGYAGTITDITNLKETEKSMKFFSDETRRVNDELSFFKFALDEAAIVAVTDAAGTITYVNEKFCQISGYQRDELLGHNHRLLNSRYHPKSFFKEMYGVIAGGGIWRGEIRNRAKDGRYYWVDTTIIPTMDVHGKVTRYVAIRADITERKNIEIDLETQRIAVEMANHALAGKNDQLSELYQTAQRFVDDVSHEFRTPLSVIKGYSEIMRAGIAGPLTSEQSRFNQLIIDRTRDMAQMVDDLLDSSKLRAGSLRVDRCECDVSTIFASVHPIIDSRAAANNIQWVEEIEPNLPRVFADVEKATRVLVNLVINAIKFSPEGSRIVLSAKTDADGDVHISVTDQGPGISPENLALIFERFQQVGNAPGSTKGFGLGLNIAKELVSLNLGQMNVTSELQKGSTFSFTLPPNDPAMIVNRLLGYLERHHTSAGAFCVLRVAPEGGGVASVELRGFLACSSQPGDVIMSSQDGRALILFGFSVKPTGWLRRLLKAGQDIEQFSPGQKLGAFRTELAGTLSYPPVPSEALEMVLGQLCGEPAHV
jgi:PAS domain S-box-containing protein